MSNIILLTAIGRKPTTIKKQIFYEIKIGKQKYQSCFLVVPRLSSSVILGNDWLMGNKAVIDYENLSLTIQGISIPKSCVTFDGLSSERLVTTKRQDDITYIQIINSHSNTNDKGYYVDVRRDEEYLLGNCESESCDSKFNKVENIDVAHGCFTGEMMSVELEIEGQTTNDLVPSVECFEKVCSDSNNENLSCTTFLNNEIVPSESSLYLSMNHNIFEMIYEEFPTVEIVCGNIINEQEIKTNNHE